MKYIKPFKIFKEDATSSSSTAGMGSVSSSQPGGFAGDTSSSISGSGDIPFYLLRKGKRKKGNPSEVSDLRDLEEADVEEVDDLKESKIFENSIPFNWLIIYQDHDGADEFISWEEDMDQVYHLIKNIIFSDVEEEIEYTNVPYYEWHGGNTYIDIYKIGKTKPSFQIHLQSDECWNDFLNFYNNVPLNESNFVNQSEVDNLLDRIATSGIISLSDIEKNRLDLFSTEDKEIIDTIEKMGDITIKLKDLNRKMDMINREEGKDKDLDDLMDYWVELSREVGALRKSFKRWGIEPGDERLDNLMRKVRPDAYNPIIESKKKFPNIKKMEIDGFEVLMGKDAESNDYLTMQMRRDGDLWLHAHGFPGSHIILRCGSRIPDQNTKKKVAELAAKNSKASGLATVICCPIHLVKKEPGSNPGKVKVDDSLNVEKIDINL
jgi:hypothetical protein